MAKKQGFFGQKGTEFYILRTLSFSESFEQLFLKKNGLGVALQKNVGIHIIQRSLQLYDVEQIPKIVFIKCNIWTYKIFLLHNI